MGLGVSPISAAFGAVSMQWTTLIRPQRHDEHGGKQVPVFPSDSHHSVTEHWPPGRLYFPCTTTLRNPRVPRRFSAARTVRPRYVIFHSLAPNSPVKRGGAPERLGPRRQPNHAPPSASRARPERVERVGRAQGAGRFRRSLPASRAATGTVALRLGCGSAALYYNSSESSRAARIFLGARLCARSTSRSRLAAADASNSNECRRGFGAAAAGPRRTQPRSVGCGSAALCSSRLCGPPALAGLNGHGLARRSWRGRRRRRVPKRPARSGNRILPDRWPAISQARGRCPGGV